MKIYGSVETCRAIGSNWTGTVIQCNSLSIGELDARLMAPCGRGHSHRHRDALVSDGVTYDGYHTRTVIPEQEHMQLCKQTVEGSRRFR